MPLKNLKMMMGTGGALIITAASRGSWYLSIHSERTASGRASVAISLARQELALLLRGCGGFDHALEKVFLPGA